MIQLPPIHTGELEASTDFSAEEAWLVLGELRSEGCGHSWRTALQRPQVLPPRAMFRSLLAESERRPTTVFLYRLAEAGRESPPVAIAAVSDRVRHDFPHSGFPVLARCYIRPKYRGRGLYREIVHHRLAFCEERWGEALRGIHVGAASPQIARCLDGLEGIDFQRIGQETLHIAGDNYVVDDYLAIYPDFRAQLSALPPPWADACKEFLSGKLPFSAFKDACGPDELPTPLRQLIDLCDAIPIEI